MRMIDEEGRCWKQIRKRKYLVANDPNRYRERTRVDAKPKKLARESKTKTGEKKAPTHHRCAD